MMAFKDGVFRAGGPNQPREYWKEEPDKGLGKAKLIPVHIIHPTESQVGESVTGYRKF